MRKAGSLQASRHNIIAFTVIYLVFAMGLLLFCLFFGRSVVQAWDAFDQHYPNMLYLNRFYKDVISGGWKSYDLSLGYGQSILYSLYFYGFADPFHLPLVFFSQETVIYYYGFIMLLRPYLAGLSFLFYCKTHRHQGPGALVGAMIYVFSGFSLYAMSVHPFFMNAMIGLPCMLMGFDRIASRKSPLLLILTVFVMGCQGFYFLYMVSLMTLVYAIVHITTTPNRCTGKAKQGILLMAKCFGYYMIGLSMAAFVFVPGVVGFLNSGRGGGAMEYNMFVYPLSIMQYKITNLIAIRYDDDVIALSAVALLSVVYALGNWKKNRRLTLLILLAFLSYLLPAPAFVLNGGGGYYRHSFGLVMVISYATVSFFEEPVRTSKKQLISYGVVGVLLLVLAVLNKERTKWQLVGIALFAAMFAAVIAILLKQDRRDRKASENESKAHKSTAQRVLLMFAAAGALLNVLLVAPELLPTLRVGNTLEEIRTSPLAQLSSEVETTGRIDADAKDCYYYNIGAALNLMTTRTYTSILPEAMKERWQQLELTSGLLSYSFYGVDSRTALETLSGVEYYATNEDYGRVPYGFEEMGTSEDSSTVFYRNQYTLPLGYLYTKRLSEQLYQTADSVALTDYMLQGIYVQNTKNTEDIENTGNTEISQKSMDSKLQNIVDKLPMLKEDTITKHTALLSYQLQCGEGVTYENGEVCVTQAGAELTMTWEGEPNTETYLRLKGVYSHIPINGAVVTESGEEILVRIVSVDNVYYTGRTSHTYNLGYSENGQHSLKLRLNVVGSFSLEEIELESFSMADYPQEIRKLQEMSLESISIENGELRGRITVTEAGILCVSIPYMKGYEILVDGVETDYGCANISNVAIPMETGEHEIVLRYHNPGQNIGVVLSILGVLALAGSLVIRRVKKAETLAKKAH